MTTEQQNGRKVLPATGSRSAYSGGGYLDLPEPYTTSRFGLEITGLLQAYFHQCSGLQLQTDVFEYSEGGLNNYTHKLPGRTKAGNVTLKYGLLQNDVLWEWYQKVLAGDMRRRTVTILVYENAVEANGTPSITWALKDALPVKWVGPALKVAENAAVINELEFVYGALDGSGALQRQTKDH